MVGDVLKEDRMTPRRLFPLLFFTATLLLGSLAIAPAGHAQASTDAFVTGAFVGREHEVRPYVLGLVLHGFDETLGVAGFGMVAPYANFAEALVGPTLTHFDGALQYGLLGGIENSSEDVPIRGQAFLVLTLPVVDLAGVAEYGVTGFWHQAILRAQVREKDAHYVHVGAITRRWYGEGFYFDVENEDFIIFFSVVEAIEERALADASFASFMRTELGCTLKL
jgi:hypothetical protein